MKSLIIDIGNTRIKAALFVENSMVWEMAFEEISMMINMVIVKEFDHCLISSVKWNEAELKDLLPFDFLFLTTSTKLPIPNAYDTPTTLGLDRIAAAIGAFVKVGHGPVLAIDLGSCVTFDLIDEKNLFQGGAISPGLTMRAKAMNSFTAKLPLVELKNKPESFVGRNTISCMQIGIWYGIEFEILGQIAAYQNKFSEIKVFVCGGDAQSFDSLAKDHIFVVPNLVLFGLNAILNHNVE